MKPTALFLSPHLGDVAFSCGATLARLGAVGWRVSLATVFTRSVPDPTGFALACQLDKGLAADVDYMNIRRHEDADSARVFGVAELIWLDFPEAHHRGYASAPALFTSVRRDDSIGRPIADALTALCDRLAPAIVFVPRAIGGHVDHVQVFRAVLSIPRIAAIAAWYRDAPYAIRHPDTPGDPTIPAFADWIIAIDEHMNFNITNGLPSVLTPPLAKGELGGVRSGVGFEGKDIPPPTPPRQGGEPEPDSGAGSLTTYLDIKVAGSACYATQIPFQFGDRAALRSQLVGFARDEAARAGHPGRAVERFRAGPALDAIRDNLGALPSNAEVPSQRESPRGR